jgi:DNA-binding NtrC family response regulator
VSSQTTISLGGRRGQALPEGLWTLRLLFSVDQGCAGPRQALAGTRSMGRSGADFSVPADLALSRKHAEFSLREARIYLKDCSRNGTWVNGQRFTQGPLSDGDLIRAGNSLFLLRWQSLKGEQWPLQELLGEAPAMAQCRRAIQLAAPEALTVLLQGPSGSGKGAAAQALHRLSGRPGPFVELNCASLPPGLEESTLFGHTQGAFTGATSEQLGRFGAADGGTLFLDEVAELPLHQQAKLLKVLDDGRYTPVGASQARQARVRVLAASNKGLQEEVNAGRFRADLYARLNEFSIALPALCARREDILPLMGLSQPMSPELAQALLLHPWPLNVREARSLANELRLRAQGGLLDLELIAHRLPAPELVAEGVAPVLGEGPPDVETLRGLLAAHKGVVAQVARATGRSTKQVYRWLKTYGLDLEDFRG